LLVGVKFDELTSPCEYPRDTREHATA